MENLTKNDIKAILNLSVMSGRIETGQRYWIHSFLSIPYSHKLIGKIGIVRELTESIDNCSCFPIEKTRAELSKQIDSITDKLYNHYLSINNL